MNNNDEKIDFLNNFGNEYTETEYYDTKKTKLKLVYNIKSGMRNGEQREYYENGNIKNIKNFEYGRVTVPEKEFDEDGNLKVEYGIKDNETYFKKHFHPNGKIMRYEEFNIIWQENGVSIVYDLNGKVLVNSKYSNGSLI